ncbi:hypothetical protein ACQWTT_001222 [Acinetobacter baumannii]
MNNLKITLEILAPIEVPKFPIHLDGLLFWSIIDHTDFTEDQALAYLDTVLAKENGIYKSSALIYTKSLKCPLTACETNHPTTINWNEFSLPLAKKVGSIVTKAGYYRKKMTSRNSLSVGFVEFYAVGDSKRIKHLLELAGFIGLSNKQGFGEIGEIIIEEIENDYSFYLEDGSIARNLPVSMLPEGFNGMQQLLPLKPPYRSAEKHLAAFPEFKVITY